MTGWSRVFREKDELWLVVRVCRAPSLGSVHERKSTGGSIVCIAAASEAQTNQLQPSDLRDIVLSCLIVNVRLYITSQFIVRPTTLNDFRQSSLDFVRRERGAVLRGCKSSSSLLWNIFSKWKK